MDALRDCEIKGVGFAKFHCWGLGFINTPGSKRVEMGSIAICEMPTGQIVKYCPEFIKFKGDMTVSESTV